MLIETLYAHGFRQARDIADANPEVLAQIPGLDASKIPAMQEAANKQKVGDAEELFKMEQEREQKRLAEERRHPDELTQDERLARVRGVGPQTIDQLKRAGYGTVEDIAKEMDMAKLGAVEGVGIKKARQIKSAADHYLQEEARRRTELDAERAANALLNSSLSAPAPVAPVVPTSPSAS
jgi:N utilization substance protein A